MKYGRVLAAGLVAASVFFGGCAVVPAGPYYDEQPVLVAPPPPLVEYVGPPPVVGYVWIGGYWNWVGTRHVWVPGRWQAPRPGHRWQPHRWERDGQHWRQHGGRWQRGDHWQRDGAAALAPPVASWQQAAPRDPRPPGHEALPPATRAAARPAAWAEPGRPAERNDAPHLRPDARPSPERHRQADDDDRDRRRGGHDRERSERPPRGQRPGPERGETGERH